jgi:hypothetical protein
MGTRSTIALEFADGTVQQVYCHWDGYLDHNGKILAEHYSDPFVLRDLIDMGDMSSLGTQIGQAHPFSQFVSDTEEFKALPKAEQERIKAENEALYEHAKDQGYCTFYGRDRNESGGGAKKFKDFADYKANHQYEEFEYILRACGDKAVWFVADHSDNYVTLAEAFEAEKEETV